MADKSELLQQLKIDRNKPEPPSGIKVWHLIVFGVVCVLATAWFTGAFAPAQTTDNSVVNSPASKPDTVPKQELKTSTVETKPPVVTENDAILNSSGFITARRMATVSAETMGLITQVNVEEGMRVEQGQVLATLDDALATVNLQLAEAQIVVLEARKQSLLASMQEAERNNKRVNDNEYSSDAEKTRALSELQSLTASLQSAEADVQVARLEVKRQSERLADHTIRAPFGGVVTVKNAQPGEIVAPSSAGGGFTRTGICTIVDMDSLEIEVDVNESFIGRVYPGQPVEARLDAYPDWIIPASVIAIIPTADRAKATVQVRIKIELSDSRILPDMGVKVAFMKA